MWIKELLIKNFGKFSNKRIMLSPGMNLIYGENESGKSTLHTFIRGCLYGMRKMRGRASKKDDFSHYQPWENSSYYAGGIRFVCGNKVFRLERDFMKGMEDSRLICETDGELLSVENGDLDMLLGGIGEVAFLNTVSIGQLKNETDEGLIRELQNYIANFQESGDRTINMEKALLMLKKQKKELISQEQLEVEKQEEKIQHISNRMQYLKGEMESYEAELHEVQQKRRQLGKIIKTYTSDKQETDSLKSANVVQKSRKPLHFLWIELMILFLLIVAGYITRNLSFMKWPLLVIGAVSLGLMVLGWKASIEYEVSDDEDSLGKGHAYEENPDFLAKEEVRRRMDKLNWQMEKVTSQLEEKKTQIENCQQEILMYMEAHTGREYRLQKEKKEAIALAMTRIQDVMAQMQGSVGAYLKKRTSEIFCEITDGYYTQVQMDHNLCVGVHTQERYVPLEQLSRGTIWQVYFAYRMATGEILTKEETLPILLDDAFVMYDEVRLSQVLKWLAGLERQVILFTCQKREKELLEQLNVDYHEVILQV